MHVVIAKYIIFFFASYNLDNMFCESATECKSVLHSIVANGNYLRQSFIFVIDIYILITLDQTIPEQYHLINFETCLPTPL